MFPMLCFGLALVPSLLSMLPFLPFRLGKGSVYLCHCMLKVYFFNFTGVHSKNLPCLREDFGIRCLSNTETIETWGKNKCIFSYIQDSYILLGRTMSLYCF
jgi:hypothetical protein